MVGSFVGKQGDLRGEREIGEATHADFFRAVRLFYFCFILPCFLQLLFFFQKYIRVFSPMMDFKLLSIIGI